MIDNPNKLKYYLVMDYSFNKDLEYAKTLLGYSVQEFSSAVGISKATFHRWQKEQTIPPINVLERIYSFIYEKGINLNRVYEELFMSEQNSDSKILFSGKPSIKFSETKKDFGEGFYTGESVKQALSFVSSYPSSSLYYLKLNNFSKIKTVKYEVSKEWMVLIAYFRGKIDEYKDCSIIKNELSRLKGADLVIAPIADNTMYSIINEFVEGGITDEQCFNCLSANRLGQQYVFLNDNVIKNNLEVLRKGYICEAEKHKAETEKLEESKIGKSKVILAKREFAGKGKYIEQLLV